MISIIDNFFGSFENPSTPLSDPASWLIATMGGGDADSGVTVNRKTVIGCPALWRGVNLICGAVSKIPLNVYRREGESQAKDRSHAANYLIRRKPSPLYTAGVFKHTLQYQALIKGNGYAYIFRDQAARPTELMILPADETYPVVDDDGMKWYVTRDDGGGLRKLLSENVLHIHGLSFDGLVGHDVVDVLKDAIGLGMAARKFGSLFFGQGGNAGGYLKTPGNLKPEKLKELKESWAAMNTGLKKSHKVGVLHGGMEFVSMALPQDKAQFLETRQFENREIANILGLPPHKLGDDARTSYNSLEQENEAYLQDSLDPWLTTWEDECNDKLLTERQKREDSHFVEFNRNAIRRTDLKTTVDALGVQLNNGLINLDEGRSKLNLSALPDGQGQKFRKPLNIGYVDDPPPANRTPDTPSTDDAAGTPSAAMDAHRELMRDRVHRMLKVESEQIKRAAGKGGDFCGWLSEFYELHREKLHASLCPVAKATFAVFDAFHGRDPSDAVSAGVGNHCDRNVRGLLDVAGNSYENNLSDNVHEFCYANLDDTLTTGNALISAILGAKTDECE